MGLVGVAEAVIAHGKPAQDVGRNVVDENGSERQGVAKRRREVRGRFLAQAVSGPLMALEPVENSDHASSHPSARSPRVSVCDGPQMGDDRSGARDIGQSELRNLDIEMPAERLAMKANRSAISAEDCEQRRAGRLQGCQFDPRSVTARVPRGLRYSKGTSSTAPH